jgi:hypothetical protein
MNRFIAERLCVTSTTVPATFLVIAGLAALVVLSNAACGPSVPTTTPERTRPTPTPTDIPTPTATLTPTPTLRPPVVLEEPGDGARLPCESDVELRWSVPDPLGEDERYRLTVRGPDPSVVQCDKSCFTLDEPPLGEYDWTVAVVRSSSGRAVSKEADWYSFRILPSPVVHSISPTCTVQGTGVTVTVSGENFTRPLTLTIGVPLQAAFVNTSTITATIPTTLEVGEPPVIVRDSLGQGRSYASFTVSKPLPPPPTPVPPRPTYPPPVLTGVDIFGCDITFHWSLDAELARNDFFALRVGIGHPGESKTWTKDTQQSWGFTGQGEYVWEVAICRGDPAEADCSGDKQLVVSERGIFWFNCSPPKPTPEP